jgi:hypothetical protein
LPADAAGLWLGPVLPIERDGDWDIAIDVAGDEAVDCRAICDGCGDSLCVESAEREEWDEACIGLEKRAD